MEIQSRLIALRKSTGSTQKAIADGIGISEVAIQRYEYGSRTPTLDIAIALADYFDVSLDYLVGRSDDPRRS